MNKQLSFSGVDDLLTSGTKLEKLIVTHPAINPVSVHLLYVAYEGWIYTGRPRWKIDKLLIINEYGGRLSACRYAWVMLYQGYIFFAQINSFTFTFKLGITARSSLLLYF